VTATCANACDALPVHNRRGIVLWGLAVLGEARGRYSADQFAVTREPGKSRCTPVPTFEWVADDPVHMRIARPMLSCPVGAVSYSGQAGPGSERAQAGQGTLRAGSQQVFGHTVDGRTVADFSGAARSAAASAA
jgi:hypothetical protein